MKKFFTLLIVITILGGGYFLYNRFTNRQKARAEAITYQTVPLQVDTLTSTIDATGKVRAKQSIDLYWKTSGSVEEISVAVGDTVQAGDVLARLGQTSLPQNVILAQADLVNAQAALEDLYTNSDKAATNALRDISTYAKAVRDAQYQLDNYTIPAEQAELDAMNALDLMEERLAEARAAFEPYKYYASGNATRQERKEALDQAQSDYNAAVKRLDYEYELQVAKDNLEKARQDYEEAVQGPDPDDVAAAQARIAAAEATLRQAWIEAPFNGNITEVNPQIGDQVNANTAAFRLDNVDTLYVDMQISEIDISQVAAGQAVSMTFDALRGKEYHGTVTEIAQFGVDSQGVVNFTVTVEMSDADEAVRPGMTAAVEIVVSQSDRALLIPNQAIRYENGAQVVYILDAGGGLTPVTVELGIASEAYSELLSGNLETGDQVVLNPDAGQDEDPFSAMRDMEGENQRPGFMIQNGGR